MAASVRPYGLMAEFRDPTALVHAAHRAHKEGYRRMDGYSPFPIEELYEALGFRQTRLPFIVLIGGLVGCLGGLGLQYRVSAIAYPINIGGRPLFSWPAFMPVTFECTILGAALAAVLGMLALNGLPMPFHPVFNAPRFVLASRDRFFLCIQAADPRFEPERTRQFLEGLAPVEVVEVEHEISRQPAAGGWQRLAVESFPPKAERAAVYFPLLAAGCLLLAAGCRQDMHDQPKYIPYRPSTFFVDQRSARAPVKGTVARGQLAEDTLFETGKVDGKDAEVLPFPADLDVLRRGQERYDIFCSPCHGRTGLGDGMVVQRGYRRPPSLHDDRLRQAPPGHFFDVMSNGFGAMPDYAAQISKRDRWAVTAFVRALQLSQHATLADVPDQAKSLLPPPALPAPTERRP